jgi:predicted small secreted protein
VTRTVGVAFLVVCASLVVAGCGGGGSGAGSGAGSHTYVLAAAKQTGPGAGIYVTIVSPVAIPTGLLTKHGAKMVGQVKGPQACSVQKTVRGSRGPGAFLNGKAVTVKINGSNPFVSMICSLLKTKRFDSFALGGS